MLHLLCTDNRRIITEKRSLCIFSISAESLHMDHSNDLFTFGMQKGRISQQGLGNPLCSVTLDRIWLFLHFPVSHFSRCLAALKADAGPSAVALMLHSCSARCDGEPALTQGHDSSIHTQAVKPQQPQPALFRASQFPLTDSSRTSPLIKSKLPLDLVVPHAFPRTLRTRVLIQAALL